MDILRWASLLAVLLVLFSSACSGYTGQTPTEQVQIPTFDTGIENIDMNLVTNYYCRNKIKELNAIKINFINMLI